MFEYLEYLFTYILLNGRILSSSKATTFYMYPYNQDQIVTGDFLLWILWAEISDIWKTFVLFVNYDS